MSTPPLITDPAGVMNEIAEGSATLDQLGKDMDAAVEEYNEASEAWLELYDQVSEDLRDQYKEAGRKTDPAEHVITSTTRAQHRAAYNRMKRAKRDVERVTIRIRAAAASTNGRQSQLGALRDEIRAGEYQPQRPVVVHGGRG